MATTEEEERLEATRMSLGAHLEELRSRLFKGVLAVLVTLVIAWSFREPIGTFVLRPHHRMVAMLNADHAADAEEKLALDPTLDRREFFESDDESDPGYYKLREAIDPRPIATGPAEGFFYSMRLSLYAALFLGAPVLLWQLWQFIAAGLYQGERRAVMAYFPLSLALFVGGVVFGFFILVPYALYYLTSISSAEVIRTEIRLAEYASLLSSLSLALGAVFQLPILMNFAARVGMIDPSTFSHYRGHFVLGAFVLAAMLTPPDPFTMSMLAVPTLLLFEMGILWSRATVRRQRDADVQALTGKES